VVADATFATLAQDGVVVPVWVPPNVWRIIAKERAAYLFASRDVKKRITETLSAGTATAMRVASPISQFTSPVSSRSGGIVSRTPAAR